MDQDINFLSLKNEYDKNYSLEDVGINLASKNSQLIIDTLKWNGEAKKMGIETGDIINEIKIENLNRPKKEIVYPISIMLLLILSFFHFRRGNI